jgi:hypothetical protein
MMMMMMMMMMTKDMCRERREVESYEEEGIVAEKEAC